MGAKFAEATYRIAASQDLAAVASVGGAATSTTLFGTQTYAIQVVASNLASTAGSTSGVRIKIGNAAEAPVANSTTDALVPCNYPIYFKVTPGQRVSAIGADGGTYRLNVVELSN
jgi:hypothetical protein